MSSPCIFPMMSKITDLTEYRAVKTFVEAIQMWKEYFALTDRLNGVISEICAGSALVAFKERLEEMDRFHAEGLTYFWIDPDSGLPCSIEPFPGCPRTGI